MASTNLEATGTDLQRPLYNGSCHCGFAKYTVRLNLTKTPTPGSVPGLTKCNCTFCHKSGQVLADPGPDPANSFTLLSPAEGEAALGNYSFNTHQLRHVFCPKCGNNIFLKGFFAREEDIEKKFVLRVNALTLDGRADGEPMDDLRNVEVRYWNAKKDMKLDAPADEPFEGGIW